ncbi:MAG: hypothetical protein WC333_01730 [Dehalococcoidia bacterium]|jgi:hypothetical protein
MRFTVKKMNGKVAFMNENKRWVKLNGYAFLDEYGHCIIIVYGEARMKDVEKYLSMPL